MVAKAGEQFASLAVKINQVFFFPPSSCTQKGLQSNHSAVLKDSLYWGSKVEREYVVID